MKKILDTLSVGDRFFYRRDALTNIVGSKIPELSVQM